MPESKHPQESPRVLAIIPARAGSKGIPGKNTQILAGKPLIAHAILFAKSIKPISRVVLSTDSDEIAQIGREYGAEVPFIRPSELAADDTPMLAVLQHAVNTISESGWVPDILVLLQPTAPFRRAIDVTSALNMIACNLQSDSIVSVEEVPRHYSPYYVMKTVNNRLVPFMQGGERYTRRQDAPIAYSRNGQFYITRHAVLMQKNSIYGDNSLPFITSHKAINLDTMEDWAEAESLAAHGGLPSL